MSAPSLQKLLKFNELQKQRTACKIPNREDLDPGIIEHVGATNDVTPHHSVPEGIPVKV